MININTSDLLTIFQDQNRITFARFCAKNQFLKSKNDLILKTQNVNTWSNE
jgi:hypothetical protein